MKAIFLALAITAAAAACPAAASYPGFFPGAQAQKGPPGPPPGFERREPPRREQRADERPGRMTDDERRALHRDLDKANRELYRRRQK